MALGYDLSALKRIDSYGNFEVRARTVLLGVAAVIAAVVLEEQIWIWWYVIYVAVFSGYAYLVQVSPRRVSFRYLIVVLVAGFFAMMALLSATLYLFWSEEVYVRYGGLILYFAAALNTVALRVREPSFYLFDLFSLCLTGAGFIAVEFARSGWAQPTWMLAMGIGLFCCYLGLMVREMDRFRQKLDNARISQIAAEHQRSIGQIAGGVAHDFNNLLTVVLGNLELSRALQSTDEKRQLLDEAEAAARRGATLTAQLLAFSRKANLSPRVVSFADVVEQLEPLAAGLLGRGHRLHVGQTDTLPPMLIDTSTLIAVLLNLILNAKEAMPDGGTVWLDAEEDTRGGQRMLMLRINDTGRGMSDQVMDQMFEPFYSTKPAGQGSGLGLPMAQGFVEQSGGHIEVSSTLGQGTEVRLWLAVAPDDEAPAAPISTMI